MATVTIEIDLAPGEVVEFVVGNVPASSFEEDPDPGEEAPAEEEEEYVDATGTADRIYPFRRVANG